MQNIQKQEIDNKKIASNTDDNKLKPTYFPGQQGTGDQWWIFPLILSPIIIVTSPVWIPYLITGIIKRKIGNVQKRIQILQASISQSHKKFLTKKFTIQTSTKFNKN